MHLGEKFRLNRIPPVNKLSS